MIALLDGITQFSMSGAAAPYFDVFHTYAHYTCNTVRAALALFDANLVEQCRALTRVALEHAATAQWLALEPGRYETFQRNLKYEWEGTRKIAEEVGAPFANDLILHLPAEVVGKKAQELHARKLFKAVDESERLYLHYKVLCGYIHPSATSARLFVSAEGHGGLALQSPYEHGAYLDMYALAQSLALALMPYLDLARGKPHKPAMGKIAATCGLTLWATADGRSPKRVLVPSAQPTRLLNVTEVRPLRA